MRVWPMLVFAGVMLALGIVFAYVFVIAPGRISTGRLLVVATPFAAAIAAVGAVREEAAEQLRRGSEDRARRRLARREKIAPHPVEPAVRGVDDGPFRTTPKPAPIVARVAAPRPDTDAPIVPGDGEPPKLLT